jgi:hypothetical protein
MSQGWGEGVRGWNEGIKRRLCLKYHKSEKNAPIFVLGICLEFLLSFLYKGARIREI